MSIATIFLIILLVIILRPVVKAYMMFRRYKKAVNDAFGFNRSTPPPHRSEDHSPSHDKKKVFTRDMGEYVAYEEVADTGSAEKQRHTPGQEHGDRYEEEQIVDAEWEEIPSGGKSRL